MSSAQSELADPPKDGISAIKFAPEHNLLLVSSWNAEVRMYDVLVNARRATYTHKAAVLDTCWGADQNRCFSGSIDRTVKTFDFGSSTDTVIGEHDKAVKAVCWQKDLGCCVSGSWDKTMKVWDVRQGNKCVASAALPDKIFTMSTTSNRIVVGTSNRHVWVYDFRNLSEPEQKRESALKFQTRSLRCFPNGSGYAMSSIEGRVAMEYFDPAMAQTKKYAFKCHRAQDDKGVDTVYPVNALGFHPSYGTFATGGCDGKVIMWDGENKKRLQAPWAYPTSIAALDFNPTGAMLAVASSYTFEEGEKQAPPDQIFFRSVSDAEVRPRPKQPA